MDGLHERWAMRVLNGEDRSPGAFALRGGLAVAEPIYAQLINVRNWAYDRRILKSHPLPRPTISVGNITTGGTGKTPVVRLLAEHFISRGLRPAVLMRGYRGDATGGSDEQRMLAESLGAVATVIANPDRIAGAVAALAALPQPDVLLLDDAFQHRRVKRDFNLVLLDAAEPFGFGHVLPRGLLREPLHSLRRADAVILTRADQASSQQLQLTQARLRRWLPAAAVYFANHAITGLRSSSSRACDPADVEIAELSRQRYFAFAGIANPASLRRQLGALGGQCVGFRAYPDHYAYTAEDLTWLGREAASVGAEVMLTTEKDWVKVARLAKGGLPILRLELHIKFHGDDEARLLRQIMTRVEQRRGDATIPATPGPWRG